MTPIAKDTPVGTRVLVWSENLGLQRGVFAGFGRARGEAMFRDDIGALGHISARYVYLDEPAPGTWAWACEMAMAGKRVTRTSQRNLELIIVDGGGPEDALCFRQLRASGCDRIRFATIDRSDMTATDWELSE